MQQQLKSEIFVGFCLIFLGGFYCRFSWVLKTFLKLIKNENKNHHYLDEDKV